MERTPMTLSMMFLLVIGFNIGCSSAQKRLDREQVEDIVPLGTSSEMAMQVMVANGYSCELQTDSTFSIHQDGSAEMKSDHDIDFVRCGVSWQSGVVTYGHTVALVLNENSEVIQILDRIEGIGP